MRTYRPLPRLLAATLLAAAATPAHAHAQDPGGDWGLPDSTRGQRISALLDAVAAGEDDAFRALVREHFAPGFAEQVPMEDHLRFLSRLHEDLGRFAVAGLRMESSTRVRVGLDAASGGTSGKLIVGFDADADLRIAGIEWQPGGEDAGIAPADTAEELRALLDGLARQNRFSGAVLIGGPDGVVFEHAAGLADRGTGTPNRVTTRFNVGSNTKDFTAAAILLLAADGLLGLDDTLGEHLDGFPENVAERVTIRHLLRHASGWGHYWDDPLYQERFQHLYELQDYLPILQRLPLHFEPGTDQRYSNAGYEVLGLVVESVSGRAYEDFVRERVWEPLGMSRTAHVARDLPFDDRARGYTNAHPRGPAEGFLRENTYLLPPRATAAGGSYSTVGDLWRFWSGVLAGDLLSPSDFALLLNDFESGAAVPEAGEDVRAGGAAGVAAFVSVNFGTGRVVVVLANRDGSVPRQVFRAAVDSLGGA